ncbi:HNH endonuclease, partial [Escherichia coli]|nr:HNH endonuclease [Escherichia coli]
KDLPSQRADLQVKRLKQYASQYKELVGGFGTTPISHFGHRIAAYDVTTLYPLALFISIANIADDEKAAMYNDLVSYVVRRAVCGLTPKNYNNVFMNVLRHLSKTEISSVELRNILNSLNGEASRWPGDSEFLNACINAPLYPGRLDAPKMRSMLTELERELCRQVKTEKPDVPNLSNLDIDHLMPQSWYSCWPLENGHMVTNSDATVLNQIVLSGTDLTPEQLLVRKRQQAIATLGNLTLLNLSVNRSVQNAVFLKKRDALIVHTNLRLNIPLIVKDKWDEDEILERGKMLGEIALKVWPKHD